MKLVRDAKTLKEKSVASLKIAMATFNSYEEEGRITSVLLHLQHACGMLLKAVLVQNRAAVFDKGTGKSIGFEKCLRLCQASHGLKPEEAGVMRAVDAMRDAGQHWFVFVSEDILYMQTRALISVFDDGSIRISYAHGLTGRIPTAAARTARGVGCLGSTAR